MNITWNRRRLGIALAVVFAAAAPFAKPFGLVGTAQSSREADGARLLKGALDLHFHMDPWTPGAKTGQAHFAEVRVARARGLRGLVIKDHNEPTAPLAYHLRFEMPGLDLYGGFVMNLANGGINVAGVEYMATQIAGEPGRIVWMPAYDTEKEVRASKNPNGPFVAVSKNGELLPEVKQVISIVARHGLVIASGHIVPEEALMVFREAKRQGVQHMIATHAFDLAGKMTVEQMQEAAKLGAFIEFDFRNTLEDKRTDAIRKVGPQYCFLSEFWTKVGPPREYGGLDGVGAFAETMRARGFTDRELDMLFKENPAKALGLPPLGAQSSGDLPRDVYPDSRARLPVIKRENLNEQGKKTYDAAAVNAPSGRPEGAAAIRLHRSGVDVRWQSPVGRGLTELAIISTAREHDQPYEWSLHEMEAVAVGVDPAVIDVVRNKKALTGVGEKEAVVIQLAREIGRHKVSSETYARASKAFGESDLVDVVGLMAQYAATATRLSAFNQQIPPGWKQFLPLPFTPPVDFRPDSRSRLPVIRTPAAPPASPPPLYWRQLAPEGTGPGQIGRHGAGLKSLETSVGRRLMSVAVLVTARAHDEQYDWTTGEIAALKDGLEPAIIDVIRNMKSPTGLGEKETVIIQFGRELFGRHYVSADTYARALQIFGERDLVDFVNLMAQHADDATMLTVFDQRLPAAQKPLLPVNSAN